MAFKPKRAESEYDSFGAGHSSTSISAALGIAIANGIKGCKKKSFNIHSHVRPNSRT